MDYFFAETADQRPVTVAIDEDLDCALVVFGGDPDALSCTMETRAALSVKAEVGLYDLDEAWALVAVLREAPDALPGGLRERTERLLEEV